MDVARPSKILALMNAIKTFEGLLSNYIKIWVEASLSRNSVVGISYTIKTNRRIINGIVHPLFPQLALVILSYIIFLSVLNFKNFPNKNTSDAIFYIDFCKT